MAARSAEQAHFLKMPFPEFLFFAASFLPAATRPFILRWPFRRLFPGYFVAFFFFFLRFFFFFTAFFFFFFFFFFAGFLADLRAAFFFAAVFCTVLASASRTMRLTTVVSVATIGSSSNTMSSECAVVIALEP